MVRTRVKVRQTSPFLHFAIWLLAFVILMAVGNQFIDRVYDTTEEAEALTSVQSYASSVITLHKTWIMQGKPKKVKIKGLDNQGNPGKEWIILMNRHGWPINVFDGDNEKPDCNALWFALQKANRLKFATNLLKMERNLDGSLRVQGFNPDVEEAKRRGVWVCQNIVAGKLHFRYRLDTGKVEMQ